MKLLNKYFIVLNKYKSKIIEWKVHRFRNKKALFVQFLLSHSLIS